MATQEQMQNRVANGQDPLTGRPSQIVGSVSVCADGKIRDSAGTEVRLSDHGDWEPTE